MSMMNRLDVDRQELSDVAEAAARSMAEAINEGVNDTEEAYTEGMYQALREKGWVPPTLADLASSRIRNGDLTGASALLLTPINVYSHA